MADVTQDTAQSTSHMDDEKIKNDESNHGDHEEDDDEEDGDQLHVQEDDNAAPAPSSSANNNNNVNYDGGDDESVGDEEHPAPASSSSTSQSGGEAKAKPSTAAVKKQPNSYSFREAAIEILKTYGPKSAKDLTQHMIDSKMIATTGKTPDRTVAALMYSEIKQKGAQAAFYLPARGIFGLTECSNDERHKAVSDAAAASGNISTSGQQPSDKKRARKSKDSSAENGKAGKKQKKQQQGAEGNAGDKKATKKTASSSSAGSGKKSKLSKQQRNDDDDDSEKTEESDNEDEQLGTAAKRKKPDSNSKSRAMLNTPVRNVRSKDGDGHHPGANSGSTAYNDDYGYMYLRYFLDITRRQEENDFSPEDDCFICKNGGDLICCDFPDCSKVYHLSCLSMSKIPGGKWYCPTHYCAECIKDNKNGKAAVYNCATCTNAYCEEHLPSKDDIKQIRKGFIVCKTCMPYFVREIDD